MGDVYESGGMVAEGGERLPGSQESDTESAIIQEPSREPGTSQEGPSELSASQEGARAPSSSPEGATEPSASPEGTRTPSASQEGTREQNSSLEGATEPSASQEGTREPSASQEGAREQNSSPEGTTEPSASQRGATEPNASQEGATEPSASQEGATEPSASQKGATEPSASQEGSTEPSASQEGATEPSASQEGPRGHEASRSQESVKDPSAGLIEDIEPRKAIKEDGKIAITENKSPQLQAEELGGSSDDLSEPHHETEGYDVIPKEDELEITEEDQEPSSEPKEGTQEEQEDGQVNAQEEAEQNQDSGLQEKIDDEQIQEELIQQYHALVQDRDKIQQHNAQLQHKLYEYFRKKKGEEIRPETSKRAADQEQRYIKYLTALEEMRRKYKGEAAFHQQQIEELRTQCQDIVSKVDKEWTAFQEQKKKIALCSITKRGAGKHAASSLTQDIELLQSREERKEKEVIQVRLENIKLKNQINRYESTLRSKEELAEGLHLIDFEQLKIENQTYNEKIEERNEELLKLRKKITNTVQVLTHVKEKLQFVQAENQEQKEKLMEVEALVGNKRDILTKTKQARDSSRMDNLKLKQKCGLLGNKVLLRDFEDKVDATEERRQTLENLKRRHAELTLSSKGLMKKISEAKLVMDD